MIKDAVRIAMTEAKSAAAPVHEELSRLLEGKEAYTYNAMEAAAKRLEKANAEMTAAQADFRKALAAHMAAITGAKVEP